MLCSSGYVCTRHVMAYYIKGISHAPSGLFTRTGPNVGNPQIISLCARLSRTQTLLGHQALHTYTDHWLTNGKHAGTPAWLGLSLTQVNDGNRGNCGTKGQWVSRVVTIVQLWARFCWVTIDLRLHSIAFTFSVSASNLNSQERALISLTCLTMMHFWFVLRLYLDFV